jgi:hypothetical protein
MVAKRRDPETDWRDVPVSSLDECDAAPSYLSFVLAIIRPDCKAAQAPTAEAAGTRECWELQTHHRFTVNPGMPTARCDRPCSAV